MRKAGQFLAKNTAIGLDIPGPHLDEIVKATRDHVTGLDLGDLPDRFIESTK